MEGNVSFFDTVWQASREPGLEVDATHAGLLAVEIEHGQRISTGGEPTHLPRCTGEPPSHIGQGQERVR
jgi:hypothetical protein